MRRAAGMLLCVLAVVVSGCGGGDGAGTQITEASSSTGAATTTTVATTTTAATTTTVATITSTSKTTTTTLPVFRPRQPSLDDGSNYLLMAGTLLGNTPWNLDAMGTDAWGSMLREGALTACRALFAEKTLSEAMHAAFQATPLAGQDPTGEVVGAFSLMLVLVRSGVPLYCPSLDPGLEDEVLVVNAWLELIGEDGIDIDPEKLIEDGTWAVGTDVNPGTYRNSGSTNGCYWERLSGFGGGPEDRIANGVSNDQQIVTIEPTDAGFKSAGCGYWYLVEE